MVFWKFMKNKYDIEKLRWTNMIFWSLIGANMKFSQKTSPIKQRHTAERKFSTKRTYVYSISSCIYFQCKDTRRMTNKGKK